MIIRMKRGRSGGATPLPRPFISLLLCLPPASPAGGTPHSTPMQAPELLRRHPCTGRPHPPVRLAAYATYAEELAAAIPIPWIWVYRYSISDISAHGANVQNGQYGHIASNPSNMEKIAGVCPCMHGLIGQGP